MNIPAIDVLDNLQNLFLCASRVSQTNYVLGLSMKLRVDQKKLLFLHHLATLEDDSLTKQVFNVQSKLALPGLVQECQEYLDKFGICDINCGYTYVLG